MKFHILVVVRLFIVSCIFENIVSNLVRCRIVGNQVVISNFNGHGEYNRNIFFCNDRVPIRT